MSDKIRFLSLGGLSAIGCKNCYALLYRGAAYLLDCGQKIPSQEEVFGSMHVPDFSRLTEEVSEVKAIFISHAHLDHIGGLGKFRDFYTGTFPEKQMPRILTSEYSAKVIQGLELEHSRRRELPVGEEIRQFVEVVTEYQTLSIGDAEFFFFPLIHSIRGAMGCAVKIGGKRVVYLGDCKTQGFSGATKTFERDLVRPEVHSPDVLLLDSTGADKEGVTSPDHEASLEVARVIREGNHQRVLVALFASHMERVRAIAYLVSEETGRPVFINGRSLYVHSGRGIAALSLRRYPKEPWHKKVPRDAVIFVTGSQGEPNAVLNRLKDLSPHPLSLGPDDAVIFSASTIPGSEPNVEALLEKLTATGCTIYLASESDGSPHRLIDHAGKYAQSGMFHVSGHGYREDLKRIVELNGSTKIIPVHADKKRRAMMRDLFPDKQVLVLKEHEEVSL